MFHVKQFQRGDNICRKKKKRIENCILLPMILKIQKYTKFGIITNIEIYM